MPKQRSIEAQLAEAKVRKAQAEARLKQLGQKQKALDARKRLKGEKALMRTVIDRATRDDVFRADLVAELAAASLKPEDRDAALWLLADEKTDIDAKADFSAEDEVSDSEHPQQHVA